MQNFIVLGIIPGTNYQTTFSFWLAIAVALCAVPILARVWRKRYVVIAYIRARKVARLLSLLPLSA